jgi:hypothetical protein
LSPIRLNIKFLQTKPSDEQAAEKEKGVVETMNLVDDVEKELEAAFNDAVGGTSGLLDANTGKEVAELEKKMGVGQILNLYFH